MDARRAPDHSFVARHSDQRFADAVQRSDLLLQHDRDEPRDAFQQRTLAGTRFPQLQENAKRLPIYYVQRDVQVAACEWDLFGIPIDYFLSGFYRSLLTVQLPS